MQRSLRGVSRGNFGRVFLTLVLLFIPAFHAACQTHETRVGANERSTEIKAIDHVGFDDWDINRDDYLMESEFTAGFSRGHWFTDADKNKDNDLDQDEFNSATAKLGLMAKWDANGDGRVDKDELARAGVKNSLRTWDQDKSGDLNEDEVKAAVFNMWDSDGHGRIDQDELAAGWFGLLDINHDNRLAAAEFDKGFKG